MKKALVLLSGGLDSTTALYVAREQGFDELYAITFEYGQKHDKEIKAAKKRRCILRTPNRWICRW